MIALTVMKMGFAGWKILCDDYYATELFTAFLKHIMKVKLKLDFKLKNGLWIDIRILLLKVRIKIFLAKAVHILI